MNICGNTLGNRERIKSKKRLETLFGGGRSRSMAAFPVRLVYMTQNNNGTEPQMMMMVSVSKRHFKHAVKRNRAKRQIRETYRLNKHILAPASEKLTGKTLCMGFIWLSDELIPTEKVEKSVINLMQRLNERITMDK